MTQGDILQTTNQAALIACMALAIAFCAVRNTVRWWKVHTIQLEDVFLWFALVSFIGMSSVYLRVLPVIYPLLAFEAGLKKPWATLERDALFTLKMFFAVQLLFWSTLWSIKFSLLWMFRRLILGLPSYMTVWTITATFTFLSFVGCVVSQFTSCSSMKAWFTLDLPSNFNPGMCVQPRDAVAKAASLYYSLAVDLLTDLFIMIIPIRLLWNLQISIMEKVSVAIAFSVGIITMICAIVRVISLDSTVASGQVNTTWLILWAAIEGLVAIIVGCLPAFAIFVRTSIGSTRGTNYAGSDGIHSSQKQSQLNSCVRTESVLLNNVGPRSEIRPIPGESSWKASSTWLIDRDSDDAEDHHNPRGKHLPIGIYIRKDFSRTARRTLWVT